MTCCVRCKAILYIEYDNKTCDKCVAYIGEVFICERCSCKYTRTNNNRHCRSYKCRATIFIEI